MVLAGREDFLRHALERQDLTNPCSKQLAKMIATYIAITADVYQSQREDVVKSERQIHKQGKDFSHSVKQTDTVAYAQQQTKTFIADSLQENIELLNFLKNKTPEERKDLYHAVWVAVSDRSKNFRAKAPSESVLLESIKNMLEEAILA